MIKGADSRCPIAVENTTHSSEFGESYYGVVESCISETGGQSLEGRSVLTLHELQVVLRRLLIGIIRLVYR